MRIFITGAAGFVGKYLIEYLQHGGQNDISVLVLNQKEADSLIKYGVDIHIADILDYNGLRTVIYHLRPDYVYHLAAQSSVELSWKNPALTADINIKGTINLLEAVRTANIDPRILLTGSGDEYGSVYNGMIPLDENTPINPESIYSVTKVCQNMLGRVYANAYNMDIIMTRAFNHIGPGQSPVFVVSDFCKQLVEIEIGRVEPIIRVGNIAAKRDFTDVRDVVRAYTLLMQKGLAGETYIISSGKSVSIQEILDIVLARSSIKIEVQVDKIRLRPSDTVVLEADNLKLRSLTGWENMISLEQSIEDTIKYWQEKTL